MEETKQRVKDLGLDNIIVLNYHALGTRYYTSECATDQGLKRVVQDDMSPSKDKNLPDFSVLIMDEQQDMTPILKRFVDKLIRDKGFARAKDVHHDRDNELRLVLLGDSRQAIYDYNNADPRFLTMAACKEVFGYANNQDWKLASQTTSYRATQQNVDFLNQQLLKSTPASAMRAVKQINEEGIPFAKPRYVICDPYKDVLDEVLRLRKTRGLEPADILVLAPSVRNGSPAIPLANDLALNHIPVFRSDADISEVDPTVSHGKVLICSYHQAKGIERKACIVLGCDQSYYDIFAKGVQDLEAVTNAQYVAATRALEHLVLIHNHKYASLPFVDMNAVHETCDVKYRAELDIKAISTHTRPARFGVTALCRNLSEALMTECLHCLDVFEVAEPAFPAASPPPSSISIGDSVKEDVSAITGTAVPAIYQRHQQGLRSGSSSLLFSLKRFLESPNTRKKGDELQKLPHVYYDKLKLILASSPHRLSTPSDIMYLSTFEMASKDKDITKLLAIPLDKYDWLSEKHCKDIQNILDSLPDGAKVTRLGTRFECLKSRVFPNITIAAGTSRAIKTNVQVTGAMDIYQPSRAAAKVWEIKHMDTLAPEHLIQLALYMMLLGEGTSGFLVSARTGQVVQIKPKSPQSFPRILQLLVDAKSGGEQASLLSTYTDEEFLAECRADFTSLVGDCALPAWFAQRPAKSRFSRRNKEVMPSE